MEISKLKTYIQSANVNFLFGSGLSKPYLSTLGDIENWLTRLTKDTSLSNDVRKVIKASIYREYCKRLRDYILHKNRLRRTFAGLI
jgi:hypothetical protein